MAIITRRTFHRGVLTGFGAGLAGVPAAWAQSYAKRDVEMVCGFGAGTGGDAIVRFVADQMKPLLGQPTVVINKAGALGNLGTEYVARAKPDGQTVYITSGSLLAANQSILKNPTVDILKQLQAIGTINRSPYPLCVAAKSPYRTLADLTAAMKQKGKNANYGRAVGGAYQVFSALYAEKAGLEAVSVAFRSSPETLVSLLAGDVDFAFFDMSFAATQEKQGQIRVLAVSSKERSPSAPNYPAMGENGLDIDLVGWWGGFVPAATPKPIVGELAKYLSAVVTGAAGREFMANITADPWVNTPEQTQAFLAKEVEAWGNYVRIAGIEQV